ncbi:MAG: MFS transporter [Caldilineaceae bacterium]|nr:MFS transporter [Caldilineaceae bacterium]
MSTTSLNPAENPAQELTTIEKLRGLPWAISSNTANTFFVQFTYFGSVFVLFLNRLGFNKTDIGFLLSLAPFAGLIALFIAPTVSRFGYKRTFITFFGLRNLITLALLLTPLVLSVYGAEITFGFIALIVGVFSLTRAVAETARFPWIQEYVPPTVQGKYTANNNISATIAGFLSVTIAGYVIGRSDGLSGFMWLIGVGVIFGLVSTWLMTHVPGGAPAPVAEGDDSANAHHRDLTTALADRNFLRYLGGAALLVIASTPLGSFVPLYMREQVGLSADSVVYLQSGTLFGTLLTSYLWGWAADRYGSKPIMLTGVFLKIMLPIAWLLMPQNSPLSLPAALAIAFFQGLADMGWAIGSARLLFVNVVPGDKKTDYMALYYAFVGITGGLSQLFSGRVLDYAKALDGVSVLGLALNAYVPLFLLGIILPIFAIFLLRRIHADESVSMGQFVGILFKGNPFLAVSSLIRYSFARDEDAVVHVTESLGQTRSILAIEELLAALKDPRFNVRFEAILAISRMEPDERLINALVEVLNGKTPALSVIAAWALGRLGDERAVEPLRNTLEAPYRSVQAHGARALGTLADRGSEEILLQHFLNNESDVDLRMAYASALGKLQTVDAVQEMLNFLAETDDRSIQMELALALARMVGDEGHFIQLQRQMELDLSTTMAQTVNTLKREMARSSLGSVALAKTLEQSADALAHNDLTHGAELICEAIRLIPTEKLQPASAQILATCADYLRKHGPERTEYLLLALHVLHLEMHS